MNYELCDARRHFALDFGVICIYLLEIFCFCFVLADIIYIQRSKLGKIHGKWYDRIRPLAVKNLTASRYFPCTTVCLLSLFESANEYNDQDHYRTYACWHGFFAGDEDVHAPLLSLCLLAWVLCQRTYAIWHGFGSA